jgi:hypothetical protein
MEDQGPDAADALGHGPRNIFAPERGFPRNTDLVRAFDPWSGPG